MTRLAIGVLLLLLAFVAGQFTPSRAPAPARSDAVPAATPSCAGARSKQDEVTAALAELRAEVRALRAGHSAAETAPADEPARAPAEVASAASAAAEGQRIVDTALRAGRWTQRDVAALRAELAVMDDEQRAQILRDLIPALNSGAVEVDVEGPPI